MACCVAAATAVIPSCGGAEDLKNVAERTNLCTATGVAGDEWLFAASLGKRSGKFLLSLASDILQYVAAGLSGDERVCMSRLCRGYTTQDYKIFKARDTGIEIGLSDGGSHVVSSNSFWSLLRWML